MTEHPVSQTQVRPPRRRAVRRLLIAVLVVAHALGAISSVDALMSTRSSEGTIAWIMSLNTVPYIAVPTYWVFGRSKFQGYVIARRDEDSALHEAMAGKLLALQQHRYTAPIHSKDLYAVEALAKMPFLRGNDLTLLIDGEATFDSIFKGIDEARDYILVQTYILRDDTLGRALQAKLIQRARDGLAVYLLYDEIGSYRLPQRYVNELVQAGVHVHWFHSTRGAGNRFQINFRNHRKVIVVDGNVGWLGGHNIGDEYLGQNPRIGPWRDTHLRIQGPAALKLQLSFVEDWHWATEEVLDLPWSAPPSSGHNVPVLVLPSGPADRFETASLMIQKAIHSAQHRIWIASPYFVPDEGVQGMLKLAALGGVDVRILIPERPDNRLTYYAAYAFLGPLMDAGVEVYRYQDGFLHGKAFLVDDLGSGVGSVNLDNRSFRLNFEITAIAIHAGFAGQVEQMFLDDFARARLMERSDIDNQPAWFRAASRAAYLFAPLL